MTEPGADRRQAQWVLGAAALVVIAVYLPARDGAFLFDDHTLLERYDCWRGLEHVPAMFGLGEPNACTYRPVRYVAYALDWTVADALGDGLDPAVYHASNVLWHLLTSLAVFALLCRWGHPLAAALLAAIWALHPIQADSVAYLSGRRDILTAFFFVLAALQLMPRDGGGGLTRRPGRLVAGAGLFALALLAKEMAVTLPAVLLLGALVSGRDSEGVAFSHLRRRWPVYAALLVAAGAFVAWRGVFASHSWMQGRWWGGTPLANFATAFALYERYFQLIVWPAPLIGDYYPVTIPLAFDFGDPRTLVGLALYLAAVGLVVVAWRRGWRRTSFGLGWFLITMLPVSHVFPHHELFAEHYLYLPLVGVMIALLPLVERVLAARRGARALGLAALAAVALVLAQRTFVRAGEYVTPQVFYEAVHERAPTNTRAAYNLGALYVEQGRCEEAMPLLDLAEHGVPAPTAGGRDGLAARILCLERLGRGGEVAALVGRLLDAHPEDVYGLAHRARLQLEAGQLAKAARNLARAVELGGGQDRDIVGLLASVDNQLGRFEAALALIEAHPHEAAGVCEQHVLALIGLGVARYAEAYSVVDGCVAQFPESVRLLELRAGLNLARGRRDLAEADIERMRALGAPAGAIERVRAATE